jgi:hypothetical protein
MGEDDMPAMRPAGERIQSAYMDRLKAKVARYTAADRAALLAFRREMYSDSSIFADPAYVAWMYEQAPSAAESGPSLWLYRDGGRIEGQIGAIPVTLKIGGERREAAWACDLIVRPELQMRGIGAVLPEAAFAKNELLLGLEVHAPAQRMLRRIEWVDAGTIPLYMRPLGVESILRARAGLSLGPLMTAAAERLLQAADGALRAASRLSGLRCEEVSAFDERAARLWEEVSASIPVAIERDLRRLAWRYNAYPDRSRYRVLYFFRGGALRAWVVTRVGQKDGLTAGFLVDFAGRPADLWGAFAQCLPRLREEGATVVYCMQSSAAHAAALTALGFMKRNSGWSLMARAPQGDDAMRAQLASQASWYITLGDSDVDRPREGTVFPADPKWSPEQSPP